MNNNRKIVTKQNKK